MSQTDINRAVRHNRHRRVLGPDACCSQCGSTDSVALIKPTASPSPTKKAATRATARRAKGEDTATPAAQPKRTGPAHGAKPAPTVLCYECLLLQQGKPLMEGHHPLGEAHDPSTVGTIGNLHRGLTDGQEDWPEEVRRNAHRNPLWWIAGIFYSLHDYLRWLMQRCRTIGDLLVKAGHWAEQQGGPQWWLAAGIPIP